MMSSMLSIPTEARTKSSPMPALTSSSAESWLCVVDAGWMIQRFRVAHVGEVREELDAVDERLAGLKAALHAEDHDAAEPVHRYFFALACVGWLSRPG